MATTPTRLFYGTAIAYSDTVNGAGASLAAIDCSGGVRAGSKCYVLGSDAVSPDSYFTLKVSSAVVDHIAVEAALGAPTLRWILDTGGGGGGGGSGYRTGAAMTNADQALAPGTDAVSEYDAAAALLTAARSKTLSATGALTGQIVMLKVAAQSFSFIVINGGGAAGTLVTLAANAQIVGLTFMFNGSDWVFLSLAYLSS